MHDKKTSISAPTPKEDYIRIIPLGGLEEIGMNCCLIEHNGSTVMIDCGLTFPENASYGVDIILPDLAYVLDNLDLLDAVLLTHGHEDHIGALPFFLREVDVPVYSGRLTLGMLGRKLNEQKLDGAVELHAVEPGDRIKIGEFTVEFVHINHSVPNAMSIALETSLGRLIFTGDWKLDQTPLGEPSMDLQRFAEFGREGTLAILGDSTNSGARGFSRSERDVQEGLADVFDTATGRVIVTQFSSNLYRVQAMLEIAMQFDRKVALLGRSMLNNFSLAQELGFITVPKGAQLIDIDDVNAYPDDEVLIISTGSQGEPRSALSRIAYGSHHQINIKEHDTIVFSARVIPGNELGIQNMTNQLMRRGARVITQRDAKIHATGHAKQEEMKLLLNLVRPDNLIPMHGSYAMRKQHAELAKLVGVPYSHIIDSGDVLQMTEGSVHVIERVHTGRVFVDGRASGGDLEDVQLRDRKKLAQSGMIIAFVVVDRASGKITSGPDLMQRGFLNDEADDDLLPLASEYALQIINELKPEERTNTAEVGDAIRTSLRRFFRKRLDRKPVVIPIVHEM